MPYVSDYKLELLQRYADQFPKATEPVSNPVYKTSTEIMLDLRPMAEFKPDEISEYLIEMGYQIKFDDNLPYWIMQHKN